MKKPEYMLYQRLFERFSSPEPLVSLGRELGVTNKAEWLWERKWTRTRIPGLTCQRVRQ